MKNIYKIGGEERDEFTDPEESHDVFINLQEVRDFKQGGIQQDF